MMKPTIRQRGITALAVGVLTLGLANPAMADFNYPDFSSVADLTLNGNAAQAAWVLRVVPALQDQAGSAWYTASKQHLSDGFDTTFQFIIVSGSGGDGLAFVIQNSSSNALGAGGGNLGYSGIDSSLAIEFDTFAFFPEFQNHISVQSRGTDFNSAEDQYSLRQVFSPINFRDGNPHTVSVRYRPGVLLVFLDNLPAPLIAMSLNLQNINGDDILDGNGDAWVGFTAGTGAATDDHDILSWNFDETTVSLPTGACCMAKGCLETTAYDCLVTNNGFYSGDGSDCGSATCEGACCTSGSCETMLISNCLVQGGTFLGVDVPCVQDSCLGACCDPYGQCYLTDESDCTNNGGTFHGSGTTCAPFPCSLPAFGACCIMNECLTMSESDCSLQSGTWHGQGTSCFDVNCFDDPPPFGACCQPGNLCVDGVAQIACEHFNGVYNGDGSDCMTSDCSGACDCQNAQVIGENSYFSDSTVGAPACDGSACAGPSPAKIYSYTPSQGGFALINTCNFSNFDSVISVHDGCPMTAANMVACDLDSCGQDAQVYFCVTAGHTYYVRVGGEGGSSGDYDLLAILIAADIFEGPFQNPGNGHWYYHTTQGPWTALEQLGVSKGGHLVTINDAAENEWVRANFAEGTAVSIGFTDAAIEGTFAWTSGQAVTYTNWELGQPDDVNDQDYGLMLSEGTWRDETDCFAGLYRGVIEVTTVPLPAILAGPIINPANCHQYYITQPSTWIEGQLKAESLGGDLVTIDDAAENEFVRSTFANYGAQSRVIWIGLNDAAVESTFTWADGSPVGYTNWNPGEPNNLGNEDYGIMVDNVTGTWNDSHSGGPFYAVIEVPANCPCTCRGDLNGDASVRGNDIRQFITCFLAANGGPPTPGCQCADVNNDGFVTTADIGAMATAALNGPACPP